MSAYFFAPSVSGIHTATTTAARTQIIQFTMHSKLNGNFVKNPRTVGSVADYSQHNHHNDVVEILNTHLIW